MNHRLEFKDAVAGEQIRHECPPLLVQSRIGLDEERVGRVEGIVEGRVFEIRVLLGVGDFVLIHVGDVEFVWGDSEGVRVCRTHKHTQSISVRNLSVSLSLSLSLSLLSYSLLPKKKVFDHHQQQEGSGVCL